MRKQKFGLICCTHLPDDHYDRPAGMVIKYLIEW
jgi:hypothetical protein